MIREIRGLAEIAVFRRVSDSVRERLQLTNVFIRGGGLELVRYVFRTTTGTNLEPTAALFPWRPPSGFDGQNVNVRGCQVEQPTAGSESTWRGKLATLGTLDRARMRWSGALTNLTSSDTPVMVGALIGSGQGSAVGQRATAIALTEVPVTMIGPTYLHPSIITYSTVFTTGQSYVTLTSLDSGHKFALLNHRTADFCKVLSGAAKGLYRVRHLDAVNSRVYLSNLDGSTFTASASETVTAYFGPNDAFYNQAAVIPSSVGTALFDGVFDPGERRTSYLYRVYFEKTGSPSPSDASQKGSYWFNIRPTTYGEGYCASTINNSERDGGGFTHGRVCLTGNGAFASYGQDSSGNYQNLSAGLAGGCTGLALDRTNQRLWFTTTDGTTSDIGWWLYKSPETFHEVATSSGTPNDPIAGITMTGALATSLDLGSDYTAYVALYGGANAGLVKISPGLVATQWLSSSSALGANVRGVKVDKTRARVGGATTASTNGSNRITATDGAFTAADVGRAIKLTGLGADAGTYKISSYVDATHVDVQTLASGAVTFTSQSGGRFEIGDRIYIFWADSTSTPGKMTYMESLAFGTLLTRTVSMTNGAQFQCDKWGVSPLAIDPANGNVYWYSSDTANQLNKYDPAANAHSRRAVTGDLNQTPAGGSGTLTALSTINCIGVNPHASFRELWLGCNSGWVKMDADNFAGTFSRYFGDGSPTYYQNPAGAMRPGGAITTYSTSVSGLKIDFGADGRVMGMAGVPTGTTYTELVQYVRGNDLWTTAEPMTTPGTWQSGTNGVTVGGFLATPYGELVCFLPSNRASSTSMNFLSIGGFQTDYQWIGAVWVAKEVVRGPIPDSTSSPGCACKDLHTTLDDLLLGVKIKFTPQGGATPANNEFIGRLQKTGAARTDGATPGSGSTFTGSGFSAGDVGRLLRIETGGTTPAGNLGVYVITAYTNTTTVTLGMLNPGTAWSSSGSGSCNYSVWEANAANGPETATAYAANGFGKDNTQDVTNITYEVYHGKTLLSDQAESVKFATGYIGPSGSPGALLYTEKYLRATNPQYQANYPQGVALPGSPSSNSDQLLTGFLGTKLNGTNGRASFDWESAFYGASSPQSGLWAAAAAPGEAHSVDFGLDVEVGAVVWRVAPTTANTETSGLLDNTQGVTAHLLAAPDSGGAPAAASAVRLSGTGLSISTTSFVTTGTADFLGTPFSTPTDGAVTQGGAALTSSAGRFTGREKQVVRITSGLDQGYYRIVSVNGGGDVATILNLDLTPKTWTQSASGLSFTIYNNAVQEDDVLCVPNVAGTHKLTVERLELVSGAVQARVRILPSTALTTQGWEAAKPTWNIVKRLATAATQTSPWIPLANGTYISSDARETAASLSYEGIANDCTVKMVWDLSDLASNKRTARYWKVAAAPRYWTTSAVNFSLSLEFYSPDGKRLDILPDQRVDTVETQSNFLANHVLRLDWIQASNSAASHITGVNGTAILGGTSGDTVTLTGGNKFLGFEVRRGANGSTSGSNNFANTGADPGFTSSDVGRLLRITSGTNNGVIARIATVGSATAITLVTPAGNAVTLTSDAGPLTYTIHEGINAGVSIFDYLRIGTQEYPILALSDDLSTITIATKTFTSSSGLSWEIRRRALPTTSTAVDGTTMGRVLYSDRTWVLQPGDIVQDWKGHLGFYSTDIGSVQRTDGNVAGGSGTFTGTSFTPDDVGRVLIITTGVNKGHYRISAYTNVTTVTLANARTGAAVTLSAQGPNVVYQLRGERRFKISRYVTVLRQ